ncbi:unnamed protein product [Sphacelaria rigidula]
MVLQPGLLCSIISSAAQRKPGEVTCSLRYSIFLLIKESKTCAFSRPRHKLARASGDVWECVAAHQMASNDM